MFYEKNCRFETGSQWWSEIFRGSRSDGSRADRRNEDCSWSCVAAGHFSAGWGCSLFYGTWNHYFGKEIFEKERLIKKQ